MTRIDDIFQDTFERGASLNHFSFHSLTPLVSLPVTMYASSKNVLTGIIESHSTLALIGKLYGHALVWYTLKAILSEERKSSEVKIEQEPPAAELPNEPTSEVIELPSNDDFLNVGHVLHPSSSIEAVNLDSWPSSETSPDQEQARSAKVSGVVTRRTAYFLKKASSEDSLPSIMGSDHEIESPVIPIKRKGLLPPIKAEPILPGGFVSTTASPTKIPKMNTFISSSRRSPSLKSLDESLSAYLTPPRDWMDAVKSSQQTAETTQINQDWIVHSLKCLLPQELLSKFGHGSKEQAVKVLVRDIIFMRHLKQVKVITMSLSTTLKCC